MMRRFLFALVVVLFLPAVAVRAAPKVSLTTLEGQEIKGEVTALSAESIKVDVDGEVTTFALEQVLQISINKQTNPAGGKHVWLADGSEVDFASITSTKSVVKLDAPMLGKVSFSSDGLRAVRFSTSTDAKLVKAWTNLLDRDFRKDVIVINRKAGVLDFVEGVVGDIDAASVRFLLSENELPVKKEKLFGVIYARGKSKASPLAKLSLLGEQSVQVSTLALAGDAIKVKLTVGAETTIPLKSIASIDFSSQRMRFLSQIEPREVKYTFKYDERDKWMHAYRKDQKLGPAPLKIRDQIYRRGLWLHADTRLTYRLAREFRRFRAVAGIDADAAGKGGQVQLTIYGDGKIMFQDLIKGSDDAKKLDFDVSKIRDLQIHVGFANPKFPLAFDGQLVLGDAKVLK